MRGVVAGDRGAVIGKLRGAQLIDLARSSASADARISPTYGYDGGAVSALDERAGVCGDGPRGPLARFVRGGFAASGGDVVGRGPRHVPPAVHGAAVPHPNFFPPGPRAQPRPPK